MHGRIKVGDYWYSPGWIVFVGLAAVGNVALSAWERVRARRDFGSL